MLDIEPATRVLAGLIAGLDEGQLSARTPCTEASLGDLLDHVDSFSFAFTAAANKQSLGRSGPPPRPDASRLGPDWRSRLPERLAGLATAWRAPQAWSGMTQAGGIDMPGEVAGVVALDEVVVHGWDIAVASGQSFSCAPHLLEAVHGFAQNVVAQNPNGTPGMFGPPLPIPEDAPLLERYLGLTGRDPRWRAS